MNDILQFKAVNCKDCYKCVRYCPVKSIAVRDHHAQIIQDACVLCGNCIVVCPQKAKADISSVQDVCACIAKGEQVYVSVAPSFAAYFSIASLAPLRSALQTLGFYDAQETAQGAFLVKSAYEKLIREQPGKTWISSCCSTLNLYIQRHKPEALPFLAPVVSPMQAHARWLKAQHPGARVVFIGPCISKKAECQQDDSAVDFALTFGELQAWLTQCGLTIQPQPREEQAAYRSRLFPIGGGILRTLSKQQGVGYLAVDGFENCERALEDVVAGRLPGYFLEMNTCDGGCIGGQSFRRKQISSVLARVAVERTAPQDDADIDFALPVDAVPLTTHFSPAFPLSAPPSQAQVARVLEKMGKHTPEDEINCGMCGYASCREKAAAVLAGKAEISMCLPYMKGRAESFSDRIVNITPNAIVAVDADLTIQQINQAACEIFHISPADVMHQPVSRIMDEFDFVSVIADRVAQRKKLSYLAEYNVYLEQVFLYDAGNGTIICIMHNITQKKQRQNQLQQAKVHAARMADEISEKQQRIVHEIAQLLGETAAETKLAIADLKEAILMDEQEG